MPDVIVKHGDDASSAVFDTNVANDIGLASIKLQI